MVIFTLTKQNHPKLQILSQSGRVMMGMFKTKNTFLCKNTLILYLLLHSVLELCYISACCLQNTKITSGK